MEKSMKCRACHFVTRRVMWRMKVSNNDKQQTMTSPLLSLVCNHNAQSCNQELSAEKDKTFQVGHRMQKNANWQKVSFPREKSIFDQFNF